MLKTTQGRMGELLDNPNNSRRQVMVIALFHLLQELPQGQGKWTKKDGQYLPVPLHGNQILPGRSVQDSDPGPGGVREGGRGAPIDRHLQEKR